MNLSPSKSHCETSLATIRVTVCTLSLAYLVTGCAWIPTMITQGVNAATTVAEHRSLYTSAEDYAIRSEIRSKFMDENLLLDISTDVYKSRVMLTGLVKDVAARNRAEELTRLVSGVQEIYNEIQVTDQAGIKASAEGLIVETKLKVKLLTAEGVRSINYRLRVINGVVYVLGTAVSPEELERVVSIAYATHDVSEVITHVRGQDIDEPLVATAGGTQLSPTPEGVQGQVLSIQDGDTLTVLLDGHKEKVRLIGVGAQESSQARWGKQARDALKTLVQGQTVRLETDVTKRDQYQRLLAYVYVGDTFVNLEMVQQGEAVIYTVPPNVAHLEEYRKAQAEARKARLGVWDPERS